MTENEGMGSATLTRAPKARRCLPGGYYRNRDVTCHPNGLRKGRPMMRTSSKYMNSVLEEKIGHSGHLKLQGGSMDGTNLEISSAISCVSAGF